MKGIYKITDAEYFAAEAASNSTLGRMKRSPAHCKAYMDDQPEPTANMQLGTLVHCLVLEPAEFGARYHIATDDDPTRPRSEQVQDAIDALLSGGFKERFFVMAGKAPRKPTGMALQIAETLIDGGDLKTYITEPEINRRTKEGKQQAAEFEERCERDGLTICKQEHIDAGVEYADHVLQIGERQVISEMDHIKAQIYANYLQAISGREIITQDQHDTAKAMAESVMSHPRASKLLTGGEPEVAVFWDDPETGEQCKAKVDYLRNGLLVDLKTTQDASLDEFKRSIAKFGYHRQNAMYEDGYQANADDYQGFVFVAVESKPPHAVGVYMLDDASVEKGRQEYKQFLAQWAECKRSGIWPAYSDDIEVIELPGWYK